MNKSYILICSFLFTSYTGAYFEDKAEKNITSKMEYFQNNSNISASSRCVWPPCDDDW